MSDTTALVPVNRLDRAKGRLAAVLTAEERARLALATVGTVLAACRDAGLVVTLLTNDPVVVRAAGAGVRVLNEDPGVHGLNAQLEAAVARMPAAPGGLLILHADLPLATGNELGALAAAAPGPPSATLVRSRDGGTNALLLRPAGTFALAYGPASFAKHEAAARAAGMAVCICESEALALDLDTPEDLQAFLAMPGASATPAGQLLTTLGIPERLG